MPALTAPNQVGVREDLSDLLYLADVKETPFTSTVKKGKRPTNPSLWEYGVKRRGGRKHGGVPDGKDVNAFDSQNPKDYLQARSEVWRRSPMVGFIAQITSTNGGVAATPNQMDEAVADQLVELKRDIEKEMLGNQDSRPDDGVNGLWTRGIGRWVSNGDTLPLDTDPTAIGQPTTGFAELPIPTSYRTPTGQIYSGIFGDGFNTGLTEDVFKGLIQSKWDNTGATSELSGFVTSVIKNRVGLWSRYNAPGVTGAVPNVLITSGRIDGTKLLGPIIDIYASDWGTFRLMPVSSDWMPSIYTSYFLDMAQVQLRQTQVAEEMQLPNLGGGPRQTNQTFLGLEAGDPRAHAKVNCSGA